MSTATVVRHLLESRLHCDDLGVQHPVGHDDEPPVEGAQGRRRQVDAGDGAAVVADGDLIAHTKDVSGDQHDAGEHVAVHRLKGDNGGDGHDSYTAEDIDGTHAGKDDRQPRADADAEDSPPGQPAEHGGRAGAASPPRHQGADRDTDEPGYGPAHREGGSAEECPVHGDGRKLIHDVCSQRAISRRASVNAPS